MSADGAAWQPVGAIEIDGDQRREETTRTFEWKAPQTDLRFVRFRIEAMKTNPGWHTSAGGQSWTFIDEIVVR